MIIILEGVDNSGKSTLAQRLSAITTYPVVPSEGREKEPGEINERVQRYLDTYKDNVIFDRHPCISQEMYDVVMPNTRVKAGYIKELYSRQPFIVYCRRSDPTMDGHNAKAYDTDEYLKAIKRRFYTLTERYDAWAMRRAHYVYRISDGSVALEHLLFDPVQSIVDFHQKFALAYDGPPRQLPYDLQRFRLQFMGEELDEYREAVMASDSAEARAAALDALTDLVYVALGTAYLHGFDFREAWRRVHASNMTKVRAATAADSKRGSVFDVVKPDNYVPPSHLDIV